jgi:hypothetical protein
VTTALVALHVTSHAEGFATAGLGTFVRLLAGVTVAVNAQTAWPRECLVACRANVSVLRLREGRLAGGADVVVVLPRVRAVDGGAGLGHRQRH